MNQQSLHSCFATLLAKIQDWQKSNSKNLEINNVSSDEFFFLLKNVLLNRIDSIKKIVIITDSVDTSENIYQKLPFSNDYDKFIFPGLENSPYEDIYSSEHNLFKRFYVLDHLSKDKGIKNKQIISCTTESFHLIQPPKSFFEDHSFEIKLSDIISPSDLATTLVELGYHNTYSVEEPGTFSKKGEIFDIFPISDSPIRLHYFDDMVEEIFSIDIETQKTNRSNPIDCVNIGPAPQILTNEDFSICFKSKISNPGPNFKNKYQARKNIFSQLNDKQLFEDYSKYIPLFFDAKTTLSNYLDDQTLYIKINNEKIVDFNLNYFDDMCLQHETEKDDSESSSLLPHPSDIYNFDIDHKLKTIKTNKLKIDYDIAQNLSNNIHLGLEKISTIFDNINIHERIFIKKLKELLEEYFKYNGHIILTYRNDIALKEIKHLFETNNFSSSIKNKIHYIEHDLDTGFYYKPENILVISDSDFFTRKRTKVKNKIKKNVDLFAEQIATLKKGDFVSHQDYGIGQYNGLETLNISNSTSDFIIIEFSGKDKIYLPVYKFNLIQKHADASTKTTLSSLGSNKFKMAKNKAKNSVKQLAFDLLKLQAEREAVKAFSFSEPDDLYREFELKFPFKETLDQTTAINNVLDDMQLEKPMDRLVCGDVGFGKTEVAMRASFLAVQNDKQVAILVPTTILALQHYNSFISRFKGFPINIEFVSRFKSPKETKEIIEKLKINQVDILIGTHKLLSKNISFSDLGLVIVDEEHRFGVAHKEKLKLLKANVDFLTLTATPIPRTLQLSFLGIKHFSLIQTAPPKRQSIKTYLIKDNKETIKKAIEKELDRGGQVYYVHNRVKDIEQISSFIRELVPKAKIVIGHGQLSEKDLETRIEKFYKGVFNVLICTTIIESGIDIPTANTMIVNRAHTFGLAQLHQLRGRIGRSDKKAYAYFIIPKNTKLTDIAHKRLEALQNYSTLGSGFSMASSDLEIRGAGDILGANQSGHIESIGLELYLQLLKEAIAELKGEKAILNKDVEIQIPEPSYIPSNYIENPSQRLKYYKKLSNCQNIEDIETLSDELFDIFGNAPEELNNLFQILKIRNALKDFGLVSLKSAGKIIVLKFDKKILENDPPLRNSIVRYFVSHPKKYKVRPDYSVVYTAKTALSNKEILDFSLDIAQRINTC